ncbi:Os10g0574901 [Oryza sativa Japonica Group]|uniref:Os10g0574901 protein n=1 Tax=Oryza sativa subsp. japonica TaxID=39947 RepID=C7J7H4_ORYSJ|nr:Os10g0574901 [Oryza sativa Japonica Group]|eukprot:NP_001176286.1 Os10g0574901 [Oryza sativa Japonica Group]
MPSSFLGVCCSTPVGTCILARKEMHPTSLQHYADGTCLQGIRFLHPRCVHNRTTCLSWHNQSAFLRHNPHQDGGKIDNHI